MSCVILVTSTGTTYGCIRSGGRGIVAKSNLRLTSTANASSDYVWPKTKYMKQLLKPSQWINIGYIIGGLVLFKFTAWGILIPIWKIIETSFIRYEIYDDRIIHRRGVFNVTTDEILLHRIKSINLYEPLLYRLVGISNLSIITSDQYVKEITLTGVPVGIQFRNTLREEVEEKRLAKGVREFDMYELSNG